MHLHYELVSFLAEWALRNRKNWMVVEVTGHRLRITYKRNNGIGMRRSHQDLALVEHLLGLMAQGDYTISQLR